VPTSAAVSEEPPCCHDKFIKVAVRATIPVQVDLKAFADFFDYFSILKKSSDSQYKELGFLDLLLHKTEFSLHITKLSRSCV
jgi:hypothetical protein